MRKFIDVCGGVFSTVSPDRIFTLYILMNVTLNALKTHPFVVLNKFVYILSFCFNFSSTIKYLSRSSFP